MSLYCKVSKKRLRGHHDMCDSDDMKRNFLLHFECWSIWENDIIGREVIAVVEELISNKHLTKLEGFLEDIL